MPAASIKKGQDGDVQREYNRERDHLEKNVEALKGSIDKVSSCTGTAYRDARPGDRLLSQ